jgi:zinc transport system substrate-binding protein
MFRRLLPLAAATLAVGLVAGCGGASGGDPDRVDVVAAFYPLQYVAERIGGNRVAVTNLVAAGAEPHDLELTPRQVATVADAELVLYLRGFQPAVDETVDQQAAGRSFDVATVEPLRPAPAGEEGGTFDPHIWLDPVHFAAVADQVEARLAAVDPDHSPEYAARAAELRADLERLDSEYAKGLAQCQRHEIVTSHAAFGYLAARYHLDQIAVTGLSPDEEASPGRLADVARVAREHGATTVFFETLVSPKVAETVAREIGAKPELLDPIEGLKPGSADDYLSVMRRNLATLRIALGCS